MGIKELVNAFNLNNYGVGNVNTNFTVEGKKIVGLFASGINIGEYLQGIGEEIIEDHYPSGIEVASRYYNLNCFPFVLGANPDKEDLGNGIVKVKLADSMDPAVIHNLKIHFANEFEEAVGGKVVARLQKARITKKEAYEWIKETVGTGAIGKPYLYCIAFSDEYLKRKYDSETFEVLKGMYIQEFNSRLRECGLKGSDFYEYKDDMLYVKNVSDKVIKSVTRYVKKEVAFDFRTPGTEDSKVENFKDVLGDFIFKWTGKSINAYEYDIFTDKKTIEKGNNFVLIPLTKRYSGQLESLKHKDAYKVNIIHKDFVSDIRGKTAKPDVASYESPVYAISNRRIAQLLPEIMQSPIAYNQINGRFEFAVDLENFKRRGSSRSSSTVNSPLNSPMHAGPSGIRTPPNQRKKDTDSGYDSNSPPKPKDSGAQSSSGGPRSLFEQPQTQECPTRSPDGALDGSPSQWSEREEETGRMFQLVPGEIDPSQPTCGQSQLSLGAGEGMLIEANIRDQKMTCRPSSIPSPIAWDNSISSNLGVSEDSPKDTKNICNEEPEKQQVTDKSDRKSSDEYSEAKSQDSKSPKKHGSGLQSKIKSFFSSLFKKQYDVNLKRHDEGRGTTRSTPETPVTKKSPLPERPASERRAKSSGETHLPVEHRAQLPDNSSSKKADRDSGFCSMGSSAVQHKGSVSSEVKECRTVEHTRETWGKRI